MTDLDFVLNVGDLLIIETGEYSDYSFHGPVKMLVRASKRELSEQYVAEWEPIDSWRNKPNPKDFLPWLIKTRRAEATDCHSWHVGCYGDFQP